MCIVLSWAQYQSGLAIPILAKPSIEIHYTPGRFIHSIRQFLVEIGRQLRVSPNFAPSLLREHDYPIIQKALDSDAYSTNELTRINCVRMYFGVTFLSEICHPNGTQISNGVLQGIWELEYYTPRRTRPPDTTRYKELESLQSRTPEVYIIKWQDPQAPFGTMDIHS